MTNYLHVNPLEFHQAVPGGYFLDSSEKTFFSFLQSISIMNSYMTGWEDHLQHTSKSTKTSFLRNQCINLAGILTWLESPA